MRILALVVALVLLPSTAFAAPARLIDQSGTSFTLRQLRGSSLVVTFIAARCTDVCPLIDAQIAAAAHDPRSAALHVRYLTITLDPEHDTRAVMAGIARRFDAPAGRWILATGKTSDVRSVMRDFDAAGTPEAHTTFAYVVDPSGRIRSAFLASPDLATQIFERVR